MAIKSFLISDLAEMADSGVSLGRRWRKTVLSEWNNWQGQYGGIVLALLAVQIAAYSYFYTIPTFTAHTFPNVMLYKYPSHKTFEEGRWLADLIIFAQGGSGVQSFQMLCATVLQALNGILFAQFLGLRGKRAVFCIAAMLCLHPAFLDYYSFSVDHITFVLGDTLALLGAISLLYGQPGWGRIWKGTALFVLALATYQPKLALVSFLVCAVVVLRSARPSKTDSETAATSPIIPEIWGMAGVLFAAVLLYWLTSKFLITGGSALRTHMNTPREAIAVCLASYQRFLRQFTTEFPGMPRKLQFLPVIGVIAGVAAVLVSAWRRSRPAFLSCVVMLMLMPVALRASFAVNNLTWEGRGRILAGGAYCLAFFLGYGFRMKLTRAASALVAGLCCYFFFVLATQESNAATFKMEYEMNFINRIVARVEAVMSSGGTSQRPFVVAGLYPAFRSDLYVRHPLAGSAEVHGSAFADFRQREILNYFIGREAFRQPHENEVAEALESTRGRAPWPSSDSVYLVDNILVILLEPYRPGVAVTRAIEFSQVSPRSANANPNPVPGAQLH